ncbi:MAG: NUDIX hydrolase [Anaeromyxobacter sp.]
MALPRWTRLSSEVRVRNSWWTYRLDRFLLPGGKEGEYHHVHTPGSAMVVPVTADGRLLLVNQYRFLCDRESLEFPGGGVKEGQAPEAAARAELAEEAGVQATELTHLGRHNPWNGVTDEMCDVFLARGLVHDPHAHPEETETIENAPLTVADFEARIASGEIWDGMTLAAWCLARKYVVG